MRFRNYLQPGTKRSINAAYELEHKAEGKDKQRKTRTKTGPEWYQAAKRYRWEERAQAYDREQDEQRSQLMQQIALKCAFVSRPFRIVQLNAMAEGLMREVERGCETTMFLAIIRQIQALMHDITEEVEA